MKVNGKGKAAKNVLTTTVVKALGKNMLKKEVKLNLYQFQEPSAQLRTYSRLDSLYDSV